MTSRSKDTLAEIYRPLMEAPTMMAGRCYICGRHEPLNQHHIVWRSWGKLHRDGLELRKPTITLCGFGNNLMDDHGRYYCHGLAHHRMLHFRWVPSNKQPTLTRPFNFHGAGRLQYLITDEPTDYAVALDLDGWRDVKLAGE